MGSCVTRQASSQAGLEKEKDNDDHHLVPPLDCDGYFPYMRPRTVPPEDEIHFFLPHRDRNTSSIANEKGSTKQQQLLACSLIRPPPSLLSSQNKDKRTMRPLTVDGKVIQEDFLLDPNTPVVVVCHGFMSWRQQMLLCNLAAGISQSLQCNSLRFDFLGNGQSTGEWKYANYEQELLDLKRVLDYIRQELKCPIACVIGHSKATFTILRHALEQRQDPNTTSRPNEILSGKDRANQVPVAAADRVPCYVNLAGRYYQKGDFNVHENPFITPEQLEELERVGKTQLGKRGLRNLILTQADVDERASLDSSLVRNISHPVLTIHGSADEAVAVENVHVFQKSIPRHEYHILEGADHNFNGLRHMDTIVTCIANFVKKEVDSLFQK